MATYSATGLRYSEESIELSILMPVYNGINNYPDGMLIKAVTSSLYNSKNLSVEVIVVNNGSKDNTHDVLLNIKTNNLVLINLPHNIGMANGANVAGHLARGKYFIIQSCRSWYEPNIFSYLVEILDTNPDIGFVYGATQYHGTLTHKHIPKEFNKNDFLYRFESLFGYMYRREAWDLGCRYIPFLYREGKYLDMADRDFQMQMIENLNWKGLSLGNKLVLNYYYSGENQMTTFMQKYKKELNTIWKTRWPDTIGGFNG